LESITEYLKEYFKNNYRSDLEVTESLFDTGALDSMGIVELITKISNDFDISIEPEEINEDNFETIKSIASLVVSKQS